MPVRNGARFLDAALESLARQSLDDFEIIAVDSGSRDATPQILRRWVVSEPRLRVVRLQQPKLAEALNHAASLARAPFLARLDADDVALPNRLEVQLAAMRARPQLGLLGSAAIIIDAAGRKVGEWSSPLRHADICALHKTSSALISSSTMIRLECFRRAGGYRRGLNVSEDFDLWSRLTEICQSANLPQPLIGYRVHKDSITARQPVRMAIASTCVIAAGQARRAGGVEPFSRGVPNLRMALASLRISRRQVRRQIRLRGAITGFRRRLMVMPVPPAMRLLSQSIGRRLRLRPLYRAWLGWMYRK